MLEPDYIEHFTDDAESAVLGVASELVALYAEAMPSPEGVSSLTMADLAIAAQEAARKAVKLLARHSHMIDQIAVRSVEGALRRSAETDIAAIGKTLSWLPDRVSDRLNATTAASISAIRTVIQRDNLAMAEAVRSAYLKNAMLAVAEVNGTGKRWEQACRDAVLRLADEGVRIVDYRSGAMAQADVAVRRHIRTQVVQAGAANTLHLLEETGHDLVQTSSHSGAREDHAEWQGRVFSLSGKSGRYPSFYAATKYGDVAGLCGANCRHSFGVYVEGQPKRYPRDPDKDQGRDRDEVYRASQTQRYHEREIRRCKREAAALDAAGLDNSKERLRIGSHQKSLREHLSEHPYLSRERKREQVYEHDGKRVYPLTKKPDIRIGRSVGAAAYRDDVRLPDGTMTKVSEGTRITRIATIAGMGTGTRIKIENHLVEKYGGKKGQWEKRRGNGYVDDLGMSRPCELHWFEEKDVGRVDMKVKRFYT